MSEERCKTCRFWKATDLGELHKNERTPPWLSETLDEHDPIAVDIGECQRFPPKLHQLSNRMTERLAHTAWPMTWDIDWCGEWLTAAQSPPPAA